LLAPPELDYYSSFSSLSLGESDVPYRWKKRPFLFPFKRPPSLPPFQQMVTRALPPLPPMQPLEMALLRSFLFFSFFLSSQRTSLFSPPLFGPCAIWLPLEERLIPLSSFSLLYFLSLPAVPASLKAIIPLSLGKLTEQILFPSRFPCIILQNNSSPPKLQPPPVLLIFFIGLITNLSFFPSP